MGAIEGVERFGPGEDLTAEDFRLAAEGGVRDKDSICEGGDEAVALLGSLAGGAADTLGEGRDEQEADLLDGLFPFGGQSHTLDASRRAEDDRLRAAQEEAQALLLHRGVEAADDGDASFAQGDGEIVGAEDDVAGTAHGAEQGEGFVGEDSRVADGGKSRGSIVAERGMQAGRVQRSAGREVGMRGCARERGHG